MSKDIVANAISANKTTSISEVPTEKKFINRGNSLNGLSQTGSQRGGGFLPNLEDLKYNSSFLIGANTNRAVKGLDFMGYSKRPEIYDR